MQLPLKIAFEGGLEPTHTLRALIDSETHKLARFSDQINAGRVTVIGRSGRHRQGELYKVRIQIILLSGRDVMANGGSAIDHTDENVYAAVRKAFAAADERLQAHHARFLASIQTQEMPPRGIVTRLFPDLGYGFITISDGRQIYFHRNAVIGDIFDCLKPGSKVRFTGQSSERSHQATSVRLARRRNTAPHR